MEKTLEKAKEFNRNILSSNEVFTYIGSGMPGGKASGLALIKDTIDSLKKLIHKL